jgi:multidrug efflux pump subunit AcrA (membrane-fusion protein)
LVVGSILAVLIIAGGGTYWLTAASGSKSGSSPYRLIAATTTTIKQSVTSTGTIEPAQQDELNFAVSGKVTSVRVAEGDKVNAGDVLATVDSAELDASLAQAKALLASAQARLAADQDATASDTQLAADEAAVTTADDQVSSAQQAKDDAVLTAPIKGVVATVNLAVGQQVSGAASGSSGSGQSGGGSGAGGSGQSGAGSGSGQSGSSGGSSSSAQFLVISTDSWVVDATVDSSGVGLIAKGDQATIVPGSGGSGGGAGLGGAGLGGAGLGRAGGAGSGRAGGAGVTTGGASVFGTISSVGLIATNSSGTASYPVEIKVTGSPSGMHAGDSATVSLIYRQLSNVLAVPTLAVSQVNGASVVYQISGGKKVARTVTTGVASGGLTQIRSGLADGDQVVVEIPQTTGGSSGGGGANRNGGGFNGGGFNGGGFNGGGFNGGGFNGGGAPNGKVVIPGGN